MSRSIKTASFCFRGKVRRPVHSSNRDRSPFQSPCIITDKHTAPSAQVYKASEGEEDIETENGNIPFATGVGISALTTSLTLLMCVRETPCRRQLLKSKSAHWRSAGVFPAAPPRDLIGPYPRALRCNRFRYPVFSPHVNNFNLPKQTADCICNQLYFTPSLYSVAMSRPSTMPQRPLTLTEELEKLEQSITLTLQGKQTSRHGFRLFR